MTQMCNSIGMPLSCILQFNQFWVVMILPDRTKVDLAREMLELFPLGPYLMYNPVHGERLIRFEEELHLQTFQEGVVPSKVNNYSCCPCSFLPLHIPCTGVGPPSSTAWVPKG